MKVLLEVHALKGSDNNGTGSGAPTTIEWRDATHFRREPGAEWMGVWNRTSKAYDAIDHDNIRRSSEVNGRLLQRWGWHSALAAFEPIGNPSEHSDLEELKTFYREARRQVQYHAPYAYFVFHSMNREDFEFWDDLFPDAYLVAMDTHYSQAWKRGLWATGDVCEDYERMAAKADNSKYEVWLGEWSLATDPCAQWLGGFNDGVAESYTF